MAAPKIDGAVAMIAVIDYGMGNVGAILNMLKRIGAEAVVSSNADCLSSAKKLILPGIGAFDSAVKNLRSLGLIDVLDDEVMTKKKRILGICLGMQLFVEDSEEGVLPGFGWIPGQVVRFRNDGSSPLRVPHMGWNEVVVRGDEAIFKGSGSQARFYFVHSYHVICREKQDILATTRYGDEFVAAVRRENIVGLQFHPEKSHRFGMHVLRSFVESF